MHRQRLTIWGAIVFSTVIYLVLLLMVLRTGSGSLDPATLKTFTNVLYVLAGLSFIAAWFMGPRLTGQGRLIVAMAIFESCAIYGVVLAFLAHDWRLYLFPWALAIIGFIREFPRDEYLR